MEMNILKKKDTVIKALSLGVGLAISFILIATICFHLSYDRSIRDIDRVYRIFPIYQYAGEKEPHTYDQIPGAIAPAFKQYIPGVEAATRTTFFFANDKYLTEEKNIVTGKFAIADTSFFQVFPTKILAGNPAEVLGKRGSVMVSRSFAEKIAGKGKGSLQNVIGKTICNEDNQNLLFTIEGIFEDFPKNSSVHYSDILLSMETYSKESTENWIGNDRYKGWVKLEKGVDPSSLYAAIDKMWEDHLPVPKAEIEKSMKISWKLAPMSAYYVSQPAVKNEIIILSITAFLLLLISVMNYVLMTVSAMVKRAKEIGMRKCYGAEKGNIYNLLFRETAVTVLLSLIVAAAVISAVKPLAENMLGLDLKYLFVPQTYLILAAVLAVVFLISAVVPGWLYSKIPVNIVLQNFNVSKRRWKLALLLFQFIISIILVVFLSIAVAQYKKAVRGDMGYSYENLIYFDTRGIDDDKVESCIDAVRQFPEVAAVERAYEIPLFGSNGNNVYSPDGERELFNVNDQYEATSGILDIFGVHLIEGRVPETQYEMAVSRSFVDKIMEYGYEEWKDGVTGKAVHLTGHDGIMTVTGVYENYCIGTIDNQDSYPSIRTGLNPDRSKNYMPFTVIRLNQLDGDVIKKIQDAVNAVITEKEIEVYSYREAVTDSYKDRKKMRDTIFAGSVFSLLIAFFGLIGYIRDESQRRSKEMAVRKINGAITGEIMGIFVFDVLKLLLTAIVIGDVAAYFITHYWLQQFAVKVALAPWYFALSDIAVMMITLCAVVLNTLKISHSNPVESLKME